jgi:hypothetical protein
VLGFCLGRRKWRKGVVVHEGSGSGGVVEVWKSRQRASGEAVGGGGTSHHITSHFIPAKNFGEKLKVEWSLG